MPLPFNYFIKDTTIIGAPADSGGNYRGRDPVGAALTGASYTASTRTITTSGAALNGAQAGDYMYFQDTSANVDDGLYELESVAGDNNSCVLRPDSGLGGSDSSGTVTSSAGPFGGATDSLRDALDGTSMSLANGECLVICDDGDGTGTTWEPSGNAIVPDDSATGAMGIHIRGANGRGVVDGTQITISGTGMGLLQLMFQPGGGCDAWHWYDIRFTAAKSDTFGGTGNPYGWVFYRCRIDNAAGDGVATRASGSWTFYDCEIDNNGSLGLGVQAAGSNRSPGQAFRCSIHHNGSHGVYFDDKCILQDCLIYQNGGDGLRNNRYATWTGGSSTIQACFIVFNAANGINVTDDTGGGPLAGLHNCVIANNGAYGINGYNSGSDTRTFVEIDYCLFHDNTSGAWTNTPMHGRIGAPGADHNLWIEFEDGDYDDAGHADGDYRVEATGAFANLPYNTTGRLSITAPAGNAGVHAIASKISDDAVLLSASAGADASGTLDASNDPGFADEGDGTEDFSYTEDSILVARGTLLDTD